MATVETQLFLLFVLVDLPTLAEATGVHIASQSPAVWLYCMVCIITPAVYATVLELRAQIIANDRHYL